MIHILACPLCKEKGRDPRWTIGTTTYFRCLSCHLLYQSPIPATDQREELYSATSYYTKDGSENSNVGFSDYARFDHATFAQTQLKELARFRTQKGTILDIGCATGEFLLNAQQEGWRGLGIEVSRWAAAEARKKGVEIIGSDLLTARIESHSVDVITLFDVLEHFHDPMSYLRECQRILKPGGILLIETPNTRSFALRVFRTRSKLLQPDIHLTLFSPQNLRRALTTCGWSVLRLKTVPLSRSYTMAFVWMFSVLAKRMLRPLNYKIGFWNIRRFFKAPDDITLPQLSMNDTLQVVATAGKIPRR